MEQELNKLALKQLMSDLKLLMFNPEDKIEKRDVLLFKFLLF